MHGAAVGASCRVRRAGCAGDGSVWLLRRRLLAVGLRRRPEHADWLLVLGWHDPG